MKVTVNKRFVGYWPGHCLAVLVVLVGVVGIGLFNFYKCRSLCVAGEGVVPMLACACLEWRSDWLGCLSEPARRLNFVVRRGLVRAKKNPAESPRAGCLGFGSDA